MNITTFESLPEIHTDTILLDNDIFGMHQSINNNIELRDIDDFNTDDFFYILFLNSKNIKLTQETTRYTEEGIKIITEWIEDWDDIRERERQIAIQHRTPDMCDPREMYTITNNIELTTGNTVNFTEVEVTFLKSYLHNLYKDYTKEEIIALAQKIIIENAQSQ